jgi:hypothetical protein
LVDVDRDRHDRPRGQLRGDGRLTARPDQVAVEAPAPDREKRVAVEPFGAGGQFDLMGMGEFERQLRSRGVTPDRLDLQTAQHDFLQPGRVVGPQFARRVRIAPKPPPHAAHGFALAERPHAGGKEIEQHAQ